MLIQRMIRAAKLDPSLYEEVEKDPAAIKQALLTVLLASLAAGIGTLTQGVVGLLAGAFGALLGWVFWALITYVVGTKMLASPQTKSNMGELLRTIGFASAPGIIRVLGIISPLRTFVFFVAGIWMLAAMVIAVRQALDYTSTGRAVAVVFIGWFVMLVISFAIMFLVYGSAGGAGTTP